MIKRLLEKMYGKEFEEILYDLYITKDKSIKEVAEELGISVGIVHKYLHEFNIYKKPNLLDTQISTEIKERKKKKWKI